MSGLSLVCRVIKSGIGIVPMIWKTRAGCPCYFDGSHPDSCPGGVDLWPTEPDAGGKSLTRTIPANYGNDPNNWTAATPSPGL